VESIGIQDALEHGKLDRIAKTLQLPVKPATPPVGDDIVGNDDEKPVRFGLPPHRQ
jgi:hypothetical protein